MCAAHQALHYHASQANLALESDAWASLVDPRNARAAPRGASHFRARASSVRSSARQRSAPLAREISRRIRSRVRGAHLSRARGFFAADSFARQRSAPLSRGLVSLASVSGISQKCPCVRVSHARAHRHDVSHPVRSRPGPRDRRQRRRRERRGVSRARARRRRGGGDAQAQAPQAEIRARRVAASATLLAIDEATSIDTRAPTRARHHITSVATPHARRRAPWRASARHVPHRPERLPVARPRSSPSSAPASARAAISPRPAPQPPSIPSHTHRDGVVGVFATLLRDDVSLFGLEDGVIFRGPDLDVERPRAPSCIPPTDGEGARGASDFSPNFPTTPTNG